jgi:hypothetical protein
MYLECPGGKIPVRVQGGTPGAALREKKTIGRRRNCGAAPGN